MDFEQEWRCRAERAEERLEQAATVLAAEQHDRKAAEAEAVGLRTRCQGLAKECAALEDDREYNATIVVERDEELISLRQQLDTQAAEASAACQEWDEKCQELEAEAAELRKRLVAAQLKTDEACKAVRAQFKRNGELEQQLAVVASLVPEAEWLEQAAVMAWHHCESCPVENDGCRGRKREDWTCKMLQAQLRNLADRIRAWRGDEERESDGK